MSAVYGVNGLTCPVLPDPLIDATVHVAERFMAGSLLGLTGPANDVAELFIRCGLRGEDLSFALEDVLVARNQLWNAEDGECLPSCDRPSRVAPCGCEDRARDLVADACGVVWGRARLACPVEVEALIAGAES